MKILGLTLVAVNIVAVLIGLVCSVVSTLGYAAVQKGSNALSPIIAAKASPTVAAALPTSTPLPQPTATPKPGATPKPATAPQEKVAETEYYRGIFDVCVHFGHRSDVPPEKVIEACRELVRRTMRQEWFETPSENWKWPLPQESYNPGSYNNG